MIWRSGQNLSQRGSKMENIFSYSILTAVPDARRGERVNIGIVVFLPERIDIRFSDLGKLKALTGHDWNAYASSAQVRLNGLFEAGQKLEDFNERIGAMENVIKPTDSGWFKLDRPEEYETRVGEILAALVNRPRRPSKPRETRINTEIAKEFRRTKVLARGSETIEDHKVMRNYLVSTEEDLRADFILKNGRYHVTATLDLRRENVHIKEATWKAVVLDRAGETLNDDVQRLGVYAATSGGDQFRSHIQILRDYSDHVFNWADPGEQRRYVQTIYGALGTASGSLV